MLIRLTVARPFPYAADGLRVETVEPGASIAVDPNLARGLLAEGLCVAEGEPVPELPEPAPIEAKPEAGVEEGAADDDQRETGRAGGMPSPPEPEAEHKTRRSRK